ncbi:hypothetical protein [Methanoculleus chikugoensis]|uniref:hypothetical protein n=1 Tax=Methanoculleus chikugoensis TaxID=118126 RepID=UPI001FB3A33E|nr:hypothetical protein [Methanoculleus chikugoensis]
MNPYQHFTNLVKPQPLLGAYRRSVKGIFSSPPAFRTDGGAAGRYAVPAPDRWAANSGTKPSSWRPPIGLPVEEEVANHRCKRQVVVNAGCTGCRICNAF